MKTWGHTNNKQSSDSVIIHQEPREQRSRAAEAVSITY